MSLIIQNVVLVALDQQGFERLTLFKIPKRIIYAIEAVLDIALNSGLEPVRNESIAKRQGIPKRYLEQTLQTLVKSRILVASRGPRGGYRLAKERRKIRISDIIISIVETKVISAPPPISARPVPKVPPILKIAMAVFSFFGGNASLSME